MRKLCALAVVMASVIAPASRVSAGEYGDLRTKLSAARAELITLLLHKDKRGPDQQKKVKDTADAVSAQLATMRAPAGKEAQFNELKEAWEAFKHTRETELVPAILKGEQEKAEKIAGGIQKERITKCQKLVSEIEISSGK